MKQPRWTVNVTASALVIGGVFVAGAAAGPACPPADMALIPAGEYEMGDHSMPPQGQPDELPVHAVYVDAFHMGKFEVTNEQYRDALTWAFSQGLIEVAGSGFVHKTGDTATPYCDTDSSNSSSRITWNGSAFGVETGKECHPMVLVSWYGAAAYANWRSEMEGLQPAYDTTTWVCDFNANGYRLPTEAEWEKAARGGEYNPYYAYPWGDTVTGANANYGNSGDPFEPGADPDTTPVGYYNGGQMPSGPDMANGYGLYDMAGNVWDWCNDWYLLGYYGSDPCSPLPCDNPHGPSTPRGERVIRGGSWIRTPIDLRCAGRNSDPPQTRDYKQGLRLVRNVPPPIPAASEWGMAMMGLLLVTGGTIVFGIRRSLRSRLGRIQRRVREAGCADNCGGE